MGNESFGAEEFFEKDDSAIEDLKITFLQIFYSEEELAEFKKLAKEGMRKMWPTEKLNEKANTSDFLLNLLRQQYGKDNSEKNIN